MDMVLTAPRIVAGGRVLRPGWLRVSGQVVAEVGEGPPPPDHPVEDLGDVVLVPGFIDIHCHGGGGFAFGEDADAAWRAAQAHAAHGTTTIVASLVSGPNRRMRREVDALTPLVQDGVLAGIHLEGPWLSAHRCGAHDPRQLRPPTASEVRQLVGGEGVRMVTIAPELSGAHDAIRQIVDMGAIAAVGHTDADYDTTRSAIDAGARVATHLFNAMPPLHHRLPGPALALLDDPRVSLEVIRDGVHVHPGLCAWLDTVTEVTRIVAVTDAMAAAGAGDGLYRLGDCDVDVRGGVARLVGQETIAGSTATADALFLSIAGRDPDDASLLRAAQQTSANPARTLGLGDRGVLAAGARADAVVLDASALRVTRVLMAGRWVEGT